MKRRQLIVQIDEDESIGSSPISSCLHQTRSFWDGAAMRSICSPLSSPLTPEHLSPASKVKETYTSKEHLQLSKHLMSPFLARSVANVPGPISDPLETEKNQGVHANFSQKRISSLANIRLPGIFGRFQRHTMTSVPSKEDSICPTLSKYSLLSGPTTDPGEFKSLFASVTEASEEKIHGLFDISEKRNNYFSILQGSDISTNREICPVNENKDSSYLSRTSSLAQWPKNTGSAKNGLHSNVRIDSIDFSKGKLAQDIGRLRRFIPDILISFLSNHPINIETCNGKSDFCDVACVCLDISGFSALSEKCCEMGETGLDDLVGVINACMGRLVNLVYFFGGDVVKVAGDALYCVFPKSTGRSLSDACLRAVTCCLELKETKFHGLAVHAGIGAGQICFAALGDANVTSRWECLISGDPIQQVAEALEEAKGGEVVLHKSCWHMLSKWVIGVQTEEHKNYKLKSFVQDISFFQNYPENKVCWLNTSRSSSSGNINCDDSSIKNSGNDTGPRAMVNAGTISCLKKFVPAPVINSLSAGSGTFDYLAEIREVTTVFMKWDDYCPNKNKDLLSLLPHYVAVHNVLKVHEGFLRQFLVDDKGCVMIACWGVQSASHPDNCERALEAAIQAQQQLLLLGMQSSTGITSGRALCSNIGSELRCEYAMVGDVINLAARLMGKAKGHILCDATTKNNIRNKVRIESKMSFEELSEMKVKGKQKIIRPYRVCSLKTLKQSSFNLIENDQTLQSNIKNKLSMLPSMLGREELMHKVHEIIQNLPKRSLPFFLVVDGHSGMGKTLFLQHVQVSFNEILPIGRVISYDLENISNRRIPYSGVSDLFFQLFEIERIEMNNSIKIQEKLLHYLHLTYGCDFESAKTLGLLAIRDVLLPVLSDSKLPSAKAFCAVLFDALSNTARLLSYDHNEIYFEEGDKKIIRSFQRFFNPRLLIDGLRIDMAGINMSSPFSNSSAKRRIQTVADKQIHSRYSEVMNKANVFDGHIEDTMSNGLNSHISISPMTPPSVAECKITKAELNSATTTDEILENIPAHNFISSAPSLPQPILVEEISKLFESAVQDIPTIMCIDNIHYMDLQSWRILTRLSQCQNSPCLFVLTSQPIDEKKYSHIYNSPYITSDKPNRRRVHHYYKLLQNSQNCARFELNGLTFEEIKMALDSHCDLKEKKFISDEMVHQIYELSAGNPFWCAEILEFYKEVPSEQFISIFKTLESARDTECIMKSNDNSISPQRTNQKLEFSGGNLRLAHVITHRLDLLPYEKRVIIRHASVIGFEFSLNVLLKILPADLADNARNDLEVLKQKRFLEAISYLHVNGAAHDGTTVSTDQIRYRFQNQLTQQACYNITPITQRRQIHGLVAAILIDEYKKSGAIEMSDLVMHCAKSESMHSDTVKYATQAAAELLGLYEFEQSLDLLCIGLQHAQNPVDYFELWNVIRAAIYLLRIKVNGKEVTESSGKETTTKEKNSHNETDGWNIRLNASPNFLQTCAKSVSSKGNEVNKKSQSISSRTGILRRKAILSKLECFSPVGSRNNRNDNYDQICVENHEKVEMKTNISPNRYSDSTNELGKIIQQYRDLGFQVNAKFRSKPCEDQSFKTKNTKTIKSISSVCKGQSKDSLSTVAKNDASYPTDSKIWSTLPFLLQINESHERRTIEAISSLKYFGNLTEVSSVRLRSYTVHNMERGCFSEIPKIRDRAKSLNHSIDFSISFEATVCGTQMKGSSMPASEWDEPVIPRRRRTFRNSFLSHVSNVSWASKNLKCPLNDASHNLSSTILFEEKVPTPQKEKSSNNRPVLAGQCSNVFKHKHLVNCVRSPRTEINSRISRRSNIEFAQRNESSPSLPGERPALNRAISTPSPFETSQFLSNKLAPEQYENSTFTKSKVRSCVVRTSSFSPIESAVSEVTSNDESETGSLHRTPVSTFRKFNRNRWWSAGVKATHKRREIVETPLRFSMNISDPIDHDSDFAENIHVEVEQKNVDNM